MFELIFALLGLTLAFGLVLYVFVALLKLAGRILSYLLDVVITRIEDRWYGVSVAWTAAPRFAPYDGCAVRSDLLSDYDRVKMASAAQRIKAAFNVFSEGEWANASGDDSTLVSCSVI